jgi:large subunit ribosomal protein L35
MPKMKTKRGAAKRMKVTAGKKIKRHKAYSNHRAMRKGLRQRKELQKGTYIHESNVKTVKKLLPYQF